MVGQPDWKYQDRVVKIIQITDKNEDERNVDAIDLEISMPIRADVLEDSVTQNIKVGKKYRETLKVYNAESTPKIDNLISEVENQEPLLHDFIKNLKNFGGGKPLCPFKLIKIEPTLQLILRHEVRINVNHLFLPLFLFYMLQFFSLIKNS